MPAVQARDPSMGGWNWSAKLPKSCWSGVRFPSPAPPNSCVLSRLPSQRRGALADVESTRANAARVARDATMQRCIIPPFPSSIRGRWAAVAKLVNAGDSHSSGLWCKPTIPCGFESRRPYQRSGGSLVLKVAPGLLRRAGHDRARYGARIGVDGRGHRPRRPAARLLRGGRRYCVGFHRSLSCSHRCIHAAHFCLFVNKVDGHCAASARPDGKARTARTGGDLLHQKHRFESAHASVGSVF